MHRDTVIGIVGVVILVAAMVGVFTYERGQAASILPQGGELSNMTGPSGDGTVAVGATEDVVLAINQTGITNITFTLTWTPGANSLDTLRFSVAPSAATGITTGYEATAENDGEITLVVPVDNTAANGALGVGDWQVTVEFVSAQATVGGQPVPDPLPAPADASVDFQVTTSLQAYATA